LIQQIHAAVHPEFGSVRGVAFVMDRRWVTDGQREDQQG
jgi:hypothetical protein